MFGRTDNSKIFMNVHFPTLVGVTCLLPLIALFFCEAWSVLVTFEISTATECKAASGKVWNFLPSISEATGRSSPQRYVWRILIALHSTPRFTFAAAYYRMHSSLFQGDEKVVIYHSLTVAAFFLHIAEIMSLVGLTFISSTEDFGIHAFCFLTFLFTSVAHMIIMCFLFRFGRKAVKYSLSNQEQRSSKIKHILCVINVFAFIIAMIFYNLHNIYCRNGVYSMFALFEIIGVISNIAFHGTAMMDFSTSSLILQDVER